MLDFNAIDLCNNCGQFFGQSEYTPAYIEIQKKMKEIRERPNMPECFAYSDYGLIYPKGLRRIRRVKNRNCPKCGGSMKSLPKSRYGELRETTRKIMTIANKKVSWWEKEKR